MDFDGGKVSYDRVVGKGPDEKAQTVRILDKAPIEVLVLGGDGKLVVRNAAVDAKDQERKDRRKAVFDRLEKVNTEKKKSDTTKPGDGLFDKAGRLTPATSHDLVSPRTPVRGLFAFTGAVRACSGSVVQAGGRVLGLGCHVRKEVLAIANYPSESQNTGREQPPCDKSLLNNWLLRQFFRVF